MHVFYGKAATWLAEQEAGEHAGDPTFTWALAMKWQAVLGYLLRQRKLALLARRLDGDVETFQPTDDPQDAWVSELDLRQIFATPPREVIEKFEGRRQEEADRSVAQQQARQAAGRYTLWDAAKAIGSATGEAFERVLDQLVGAADTGELTVYQAGVMLPRKPEGPLGATSGDEVTWSDLNAWLRAAKNLGDFAFPEPQGEQQGVQLAPARDLPRQRRQEQEILRVLRELGYEPMRLPPWRNTKAAAKKVNVKAEVRGHFKWSAGVFDKAWERLRHPSDRRIKFVDEE